MISDAGRIWRMAGMGYFRDRIAFLDKGSQEFVTVLVAMGGYCTVSQAEALKIVKSTRARARLRALERLGFLRKVAAYLFFSSRRRHTRLQGDWSSDVCSSD